MPAQRTYAVIRSSGVDREIKNLRKRFRKIDEDVQAAEETLSHSPDTAGTPIPETGGAWKARAGMPSHKISKRDGLRLIYFIQKEPVPVVLWVVVYYKPDRANILAHEIKRALSDQAPSLEAALEQQGIDPGPLQDLLKTRP